MTGIKEHLRTAALVSALIAFVDGARDTVCQRRRTALEAAEAGVAGLGPVAEQPVVAVAVDRGVQNLIRRLVAAVGRADDFIADRWGATVDASDLYVTRLGPVAELVVVALRVVRGVDDGVGGLVTLVESAGDAIS